MRDTAFVFFVAAVLCVVAGMLWGIWMAISHDHLLAPAHAHLNLVGWVTLALYGVYYRLTPPANAARLARVHAGVAIPGVVVMVAGIALVRSGGSALDRRGGRHPVPPVGRDLSRDGSAPWLRRSRVNLCRERTSQPTTRRLAS